MTKTYIAGPMTGLPDLNFPAFHQAAEWLRGMGHEVVNPAEINPDTSMEWHECMRADIAQLVTCQCIYLLPGWEDSRGATLEHHIAERLGLTITKAPVPVTEFQRLRGEAKVLRDIMAELLSVVEEVDSEDTHEYNLLRELTEKSRAAIRGVPA